MAESPRLSVALVEPTTLLGRELRRVLPESGLLVSDPVLLDQDERAGTLTAYDDEPILVQAVSDAALAGVDVAFFCGRSPLLATWQPMLEKGTVLAVDLAGDGGEAALVVAGVNDAPLHGQRVLRSPSPPGLLLARVLGAVRDVGRARAEVVVFLPAASADLAGVEELHAQTLGILNVSSVPQEVFARQLAFNLYPADDDAVAGKRLVAEVKAVLGDAAPEMQATLVRVPLFLGLTALVLLDFAVTPEVGAVERALAATSGLKLVASGPAPSPLEQAESESDDALVSVLPDQGGQVRLWCVADYPRLIVRNALDVVGALVARGEVPIT